MQKWLLILILVSGMHQLKAQVSKSVGLHFNHYKADNEFRNQITRNPIGVALSFIADPENNNWQFGIEVGMGLYSGKKYFYETIAEGYPDNFVYLYEENGFISYSAILRYKTLKNKAVSPFLETRIGASSFFSAIRSMQYSAIYDDNFSFQQTVPHIGLGGGFLVDIGLLFENEIWKKKLIFQFNGSQISGSEATYRNSVKNEVVDSYDDGFRRSKTNSFLMQFGFVLAF